MSAMIAGIDPGKNGYVAAITSDGSDVAWTAPIPTIGKAGYDLPALWEIMQRLSDCRVILERQQAMPKQGVSTTFTIGYGYGLLQGMLIAAGASHEVVRPSEWKRVMSCTVSGAGLSAYMKKKLSKSKAIAKAQSLFPRHDFRDARKPRSKAPCGDHAEAVLLAVYGRRIHG